MCLHHRCDLCRGGGLQKVVDGQWNSSAFGQHLHQLQGTQRIQPDIPEVVVNPQIMHIQHQAGGPNDRPFSCGEGPLGGQSVAPRNHLAILQGPPVKLAPIGNRQRLVAHDHPRNEMCR